MQSKLGFVTFQRDACSRADQSVFGQRSATDRIAFVSPLARGARARINYECGVKGSNFTATAHKCPTLDLEKVKFRQFKQR